MKSVKHKAKSIDSEPMSTLLIPKFNLTNSEIKFFNSKSTVSMRKGKIKKEMAKGSWGRRVIKTM